MELIEKLDAAKKVLDDAQADVLKWCQDQRTPFDERWKVWEKHSYKNTSSYMRINGSKILNDIFRMFADNGYFERHQTISYDSILDYACDMWGDEPEDNAIIKIIKKNITELRDRKLSSVLSDDSNSDATVISIPKDVNELEAFLKNEIILANFGDTIFDW
jgi:hypothetical protein